MYECTNQYRVRVRVRNLLDEESVDNFMEVEKKGGEERGVVSTVISSINMWNRPRRLVGKRL